MSDRAEVAPSAADVAALAVALERDARLPETERRERDRQLARELPKGSASRGAQALHWLHGQCGLDRDLRLLRSRAESSLGLAQFLLTLLGLLAGWLAAFGAFAYDGLGRVNVLAVLAVLVFLPALLLLPFLLAALPGRALGWIPGAKAAGALCRGLSPGRLLPGLLRLLPREGREAWESLAGHVGAHQTVYGGVQKWLLLRASQLFALGFQLAALTGATALVVFSDLVFGWSTTLTSGDAAADAARVHQMVSVLATPWEGVLPAAVPDPQLVAEARYYRAVEGTLSPAEAARLGQWWPFVILSMLLYGLVPRVLTLAIANRQLRRANRRALATVPGITTVLARLRHAGIETTGPQNEATSSPAAREDAAGVAVEPVPDAPAALVNWAAFPCDDAALARSFGNPRIGHAGGAGPVAADATVLDALEPLPEGPLVIIVKAWEPPLLEFVDWVRALRGRLGPARELVVVPLALDEAGELCDPPDKTRQVWRRQLAKAGDPWLRVAAFSPASERPA